MEKRRQQNRACMVSIHSGQLAPNTPTRPLTGTPTSFKPLAMSATLASACSVACNGVEPPAQVKVVMLAVEWQYGLAAEPVTGSHDAVQPRAGARRTSIVYGLLVLHLAEACAYKVWQRHGGMTRCALDRQQGTCWYVIQVNGCGLPSWMGRHPRHCLSPNLSTLQITVPNLMSRLG